MGDVLSGIFGGGGKQDTSITVDPATASMNNIKEQQLKDLFNYNSIGSYAGARPDIFSTPQGVNDLYSVANAQNQQVTQAASLQAQQAPLAPNNYNNLMDLNDYIKLGLDTSSNYIHQIATPEIMSQAVLQGLEGSGMVPEAIAKATAGVALPFVQGLPAASNLLTQAGPQAELTRSQTGLTNAQTGLAQANTLQTGAQSGVLGAQRATTLLPFADFGRSLSQQDFLRQQGVITTGLTGLPYTPQTTTATDKSQQPLFNWFGQG